jgi:hypothetical protein
MYRKSLLSIRPIADSKQTSWSMIEMNTLKIIEVVLL